jgi:hypothetical protein
MSWPSLPKMSFMDPGPTIQDSVSNKPIPNEQRTISDPEDPSITYVLTPYYEGDFTHYKYKPSNYASALKGREHCKDINTCAILLYRVEVFIHGVFKCFFETNTINMALLHEKGMKCKTIHSGGKRKSRKNKKLVYGRSLRRNRNSPR